VRGEAWGGEGGGVAGAQAEDEGGRDRLLLGHGSIVKGVGMQVKGGCGVQQREGRGMCGACSCCWSRAAKVVRLSVASAVRALLRMVLDDRES
jgi:hypothetical protein